MSHPDRPRFSAVAALRAAARAVFDGRLTPAEPAPTAVKAVLLTLASWADRDGVSRPFTRTLEGETGLHRRTVQRALRALQRLGYIERARDPELGPRAFELRIGRHAERGS